MVTTMYQGTTVGDTLYWDGTNWVIVPAHVAATLALLRQTGTGSAGGVPTWDTTHGSAQHDSTTRLFMENIRPPNPCRGDASTATSNRMYTTLFVAERDVTIDYVLFSFSGVSGNIKAFIYPVTAANLLPDGLSPLWASGSTAVAAGTLIAISPALSLTKGVYAVGFVIDNATAVFFRYARASYDYMLDSSGNQHMGRDWDVGSYTVPDPCPTGGTVDDLGPAFVIHVKSVDA